MAASKRRYYPVNYPNSTYSGVTGIRSREHCDYTELFITGFYRTEEVTTSQSFVYQGNKRGKGVFHDLNYPPEPKLTPTATELYSLSLISKRKIQAVGSFSASEFSGVQGCLYTGSLLGGGKLGTWQPLVPQELTPLPVLSTIVHSVMGDVAVGNYKTDERFSNAFVYDIKTRQYFPLVTSEFPILSITAYGVWQKDDEDHYVIVGGLVSRSRGQSAELIDNEQGFMVNWNNRTRRLSGWRLFTAPDTQATHFEGISGVADRDHSYTLAAQSAVNAYFVRVDRDKVTWEVLNYPGSTTTTSDSVAEDIVIGSFIPTDSSSLRGYIGVPSRRC